MLAGRKVSGWWFAQCLFSQVPGVSGLLLLLLLVLPVVLLLPLLLVVLFSVELLGPGCCCGWGVVPGVVGGTAWDGGDGVDSFGCVVGALGLTCAGGVSVVV